MSADEQVYIQALGLGLDPAWRRRTDEERHDDGSRFGEAADSAPAFGDRRGYQMDPANGREALREMELDIAEGADILLVKPALPGLDLVAAARARFDVPIAAYQVSGEFAMIAAAAERGWLDGRRAMTEAVTAIVRAGAGIVITYAAADLATWLREER